VSVTNLSTPITFHLRSQRVLQRFNAPPIHHRCVDCPQAYDAICYYPRMSVSIRTTEHHSNGKWQENHLFASDDHLGCFP
jgi:hypothetical protein